MPSPHAFSGSAAYPLRRRLTRSSCRHFRPRPTARPPGAPSPASAQARQHPWPRTSQAAEGRTKRRYGGETSPPYPIGACPAPLRTPPPATAEPDGPGRGGARPATRARRPRPAEARPFVGPGSRPQWMTKPARSRGRRHAPIAVTTPGATRHRMESACGAAGAGGAGTRRAGASRAGAGRTGGRPASPPAVVRRRFGAAGLARRVIPGHQTPARGALAPSTGSTIPRGAGTLPPTRPVPDSTAHRPRRGSGRWPGNRSARTGTPAARSASTSAFCKR